MSLLRRLSRAFATIARPHLESRVLFGAQGEEYARQVIEQSPIIGMVMNPIIPVANGHRHPLESDFLVYTWGNLFCVEVKNYKGRITYASGDDSVILQYNRGHLKRHRNPLKSAKTFMHHLKNYLGDNIDPRFRGLFLIPVAAFTENADISAIHSIDQGIIYVRELPEFFRQHADAKFARVPSRWVAKGMLRVPTSDLVVTTDNEPFKGFLADQTLTFKKREGGLEHLPYTQIKSVRLRRAGLFSDYDAMTVFSIDGAFREFEAISGEIHLTEFDGKQRTHQLSNVVQIVVGRANKQRRLD